MCRRAQPGYLSGYDNMTKKDYNCKTIQERTEKDNPKIKKLVKIINVLLIIIKVLLLLHLKEIIIITD